jgi:hypothetical protein
LAKCDKIYSNGENEGKGSLLATADAGVDLNKIVVGLGKNTLNDTQMSAAVHDEPCMLSVFSYVATE